jgi:hypothetical protein
MTNKVVHSANMQGIEMLLNHDNRGSEYLCCSSKGCTRYMDTDVAFLIEGNVLRKFSGDIGDLDLADNPQNYGYDELHIANDYEVKALYIPDDNGEWDLEIFRDAYYYITEILQKNIEVIAEDGDQEKVDFVKDHKPYYPENMSDEKFVELWQSYFPEMSEGELV